MNDKIKKEREEFVKKVVESLEKGDIPWKKEWEGIGMPVNASSNARYRGYNSIKLYMADITNHYNDNRWMTFNQAKNAGYHIKKGSKAVSIEVFKYYDKSTKKDLDFKMLEKLSFDQRMKYVEDNCYAVIQSYSVFNGKQIEGLPPLEVNTKKAEYHEIDKIMQNSGVDIIYGGDRACYVPSLDVIKLPEKEAFKNEEAFYGTALHEIAHSTGHESRLNRKLEGNFGSESYAKEELVAEFASVFIQQEKGISYNETNNIAYLQGWAKTIKEDNNVLFQAMKEADKAAEMVLGYEKVKNIEKEKTVNSEKSEDKTADTKTEKSEDKTADTKTEKSEDKTADTKTEKSEDKTANTKTTKIKRKTTKTANIKAEKTEDIKTTKKTKTAKNTVKVKKSKCSTTKNKSKSKDKGMEL